jgi:quercetin dioxygenase-like cupin family protein
MRIAVETPYTYFLDLAAELPEIPPDSIISRTIFSEGQLKAILFGFAEGQELSEHTSTQEALLYFVQGEADLTLGGERQTARQGTWVRMEPNLAHSVLARTPLVMLLLMLRPA